MLCCVSPAAWANRAWVGVCPCMKKGMDDVIVLDILRDYLGFSGVPFRCLLWFPRIGVNGAVCFLAFDSCIGLSSIPFFSDGWMFPVYLLLWTWSRPSDWTPHRPQWPHSTPKFPQTCCLHSRRWTCLSFDLAPLCQFLTSHTPPVLADLLSSLPVVGARLQTFRRTCCRNDVCLGVASRETDLFSSGSRQRGQRSIADQS